MTDDPTDPHPVADDPSGIVQQMPDENNTPERIWVRVTDKTVMATKPSDADEFDVEYIRADRAAPDTCWRCGGTGLTLNDTGEPGLCPTCKGDTVVARAAPTDNTALVEGLTRYDPDYCDRMGNRSEMTEEPEGDYLLRDDVIAALASREAPPACQQEAVTVALKLAATRLQRLALGIPSTTPLRADVFEWAEEALRALKGDQK